MKHLVANNSLYVWITLLALACGDGAAGNGDADESDPAGSAGTGATGSSGSGSAGAPGTDLDLTSYGGSAPGGGSDEARSGTTECGLQTCSAGQYCDNSLCSNGCLSDDNCTSTQTCDKAPGNNVGSCQTHASTAKDCPAYVQKCVACAGGSSDECQRQCDVANAECTSCVIDNSGCVLADCFDVCQF